MSLLSSLFKGSRKVNLTPDVVPLMPQEINPEMYGNLSTLAKRRIQAGITGEETPGVGFGPDFVSKTTNPVADSMRRNYRQFTAPATASAYSSRGLGRSSLAANELGRQEGDVESNVGNLMAQFYQLNEAQKKNDIATGINTGSTILSNDVGAQHDIASASERLANATAADARYRESADNAKAQQLGQAAVALGAAPFTGGASLAAFGVSGMGKTDSGIPKLGSSATTQILGSKSNKEFEDWLNSFLGGD